MYVLVHVTKPWHVDSTTTRGAKNFITIGTAATIVNFNDYSETVIILRPHPKPQHNSRKRLVSCDAQLFHILSIRTVHFPVFVCFMVFITHILVAVCIYMVVRLYGCGMYGCMFVWLVVCMYVCWLLYVCIFWLLVYVLLFMRFLPLEHIYFNNCWKQFWILPPVDIVIICLKMCVKFKEVMYPFRCIFIVLMSLS